MMRLPNVNARLQMDMRWNTLTLVHGCYWKKCTFCDMSAATTRHRSSGSSNVCGRLPRRRVARAPAFVDEAAPPKLLRALSHTLIERGLTFSWLTNIRFERIFANPTLTDRMARAGCIFLSGGLETASDRLLELIDKGAAPSRPHAPIAP